MNETYSATRTASSRRGSSSARSLGAPQASACFGARPGRSEIAGNHTDHEGATLSRRSGRGR